MLNFEKLLEEIGEFGNYQKYAIILLQERFEFLGSIGKSERLLKIGRFPSLVLCRRYDHRE